MVRVFVDSGFDPVFPVSRRELAELVKEIRILIGEERDIEIRLVDDRIMADYNRRFLGLPGPTNVLSFPAEEDGLLPGQIVLSTDALEREAFLYGQPPREQAVRLLAHAVLHLAGFDHGPEMDLLTDHAVSALS